MFIKNIFYYLLLNLIIYINLIKSEKFLYSNHTLSSLSKYEHFKWSCDEDRECGDETFCNYFENGNICVLGVYICKEDENSKCIFIDTYDYNTNTDETRYNSHNKEKLIFKSCDKVNVDAKICETEQCTKDTDCLSGVCYSNSCIAEKPIYVCSDISVNDEKMGMNCKKQNQMKCISNSDCYSDNCEESGYCGIRIKEDYDENREKEEKKRKMKINISRIIVGVALTLAIIFFIVSICIFKKCKCILLGPIKVENK
ncbi:hypothetical protein BCR32DRAFT_299193 [Anaeromyces robustus]|uniref:Uncharacterized protein n=1 Tax=Anaeromyces robustus TaxID=1754192 RepID=A0A1Y1XNI2_9FUNG|nr:hypothetical protein BCR32DRAFT_299193 [Anaeromyces robustus]|eukprot:ORX87225.1 hypothetical protein BCR32DRAFT_299193 [Anaeromyces robustus]